MTDKIFSDQFEPRSVVLSGPILRKAHQHEVNFWLVSQMDLAWRCLFYNKADSAEPYSVIGARCDQKKPLQEEPSEDSELKIEQFQVSPRCFILNISAHYPSGFALDRPSYYDLQFRSTQHDDWISIKQWGGESLTYSQLALPFFVIKSQHNRFFHGSCRKPHHCARDGLARADRYCQHLIETEGCSDQFPGLLVMSGDQVYVDDVAGPMLVAIHQLMDWLKLPTEAFNSDCVKDSQSLFENESLLYGRDQLLPDTSQSTSAYDAIFGGAKKPVFTSVNAKNHLISLSEIIALYVLVWSPVCWQNICLKPPVALDDQKREVYDKERLCLEGFVAQLPAVRRLMAHISVAMIFDDHDITDDWNLTANWERAVYDNPFSRRIVGNALIAYLLCQGLGNAPEKFPASLLEQTKAVLKAPGSRLHDQLIQQLLDFSDWDYYWPSNPPLVVLDTRTQRWRSERSPAQPSGLLDWEALMRLHEQLMHKESVLLVAPAPIFGVKIIEAIQRVMTWFGFPLTVDAENWMAHPGTASTVLNMFCHANTPRNFLILSGDVHYSFVYHVKIRGQKSSPDIWQITSSGFRNTFPQLLLSVLDRLNRWLYAPSSPLNWFTRRRDMVVTPYRPMGASKGERLVKHPGVGLVVLDKHNRPEQIWQLSDEDKDVRFMVDDS